MLRFEGSTAKVRKNLREFKKSATKQMDKQKQGRSVRGMRCCISYGLWKCFDSIRREASWEILEAWGVDKGTLEAMRQWHKRAKRYRKIRVRI